MNFQIINIKKLDNIIGIWKGNGIAKYPTIATVEYLEELVIKKNNEFPVIQYEQQTWIKSASGLFDDPIFWETGFIIAKEKENQFEICNAQKRGRIEVLAGKIIKNLNDSIEISFKSKIISNDERMVKSGRDFIFTSKMITYKLHMSTNNNSKYDLHLIAELRKIK